MVPENRNTISPHVCFGMSMETIDHKKTSIIPSLSVVSVVAAVLLLGNFAHSASPSQAKVKNGPHSKVKKTTKVASSNVAKDDLSYYLTAMRTNLFEPPVTKSPKIQVTQAVRPMPVMQAPPDPLSGWAYTGIVDVGGKVEALLENGNNPGIWVSAGGNFLGGKVTSVSNQMVIVNMNGKTSMLPISQTDNPVPLNAIASPTAATPGKPATSTAPVANAAAHGFPPGMNPQLIQRMMKRMAKRGGNMFFPNGKRIFNRPQGGK